MTTDGEGDQNGSSSKLKSLLRCVATWFHQRLIERRPNILTVILIALFTSIGAPLIISRMTSPKVKMNYGITHRSERLGDHHFIFTVTNIGTASIPAKEAEFKLRFQSDIIAVRWLQKPVRGTTHMQCMANGNVMFHYSLVFGGLSPKASLRLSIYSRAHLEMEPRLQHAGNPYGMDPDSCDAEGTFGKKLCNGELGGYEEPHGKLEIMDCPKNL